MSDTSQRLLRLLSLLRARRERSGAELAERLGVHVRTVRRDVDRLRALGIPVAATSGTAGGYRLGAGAEPPPLWLDDDEAVAVVAGLRTAVGGMAAPSARALAKVERAFPARVRHRLGALGEVMVMVPGACEAAAPSVSPSPSPSPSQDEVGTIAAACVDHETLRFDYRTHEGTRAVRTVEPHRLACAGRRWYLLGWDVDRADWRTFRVDRIRLRESRGPRFAPRALPDGDVAAFIAAGIAPRGRDRRAVVVLPMSAEEAAAAHIADRDEAVEAMDATACRATVTARSTQGLALRLAGLGVDFDVVEAPPELAVCLGELGRRLVRAAAG